MRPGKKGKKFNKNIEKYDEKNARAHIKRVRDILSVP
jgi:hypothetical protein